MSETNSDKLRQQVYSQGARQMGFWQSNYSGLSHDRKNQLITRLLNRSMELCEMNV